MLMSWLAVAALTAFTSVQTIKPATQFAKSTDGTRIAYDVTGSGPVVILLHGGGMTRRSWHEAGYVARLAKEFTVVTLDIRGNGESDKPATIEAFAPARLNQDVLAVANAVKAERFAIWGFSYGANVGRYLAAVSDRVRGMVYIGIQFGPGAEGMFREVHSRPREPSRVVGGDTGLPGRGAFAHAQPDVVGGRHCQ